jgi:hypothetical protein
MAKSGVTECLERNLLVQCLQAGLPEVANTSGCVGLLAEIEVVGTPFQSRPSVAVVRENP